MGILDNDIDLEDPALYPPDTLPLAIADAVEDATELRQHVEASERRMNAMMNALRNAKCVLGILERTIANCEPTA